MRLTFAILLGFSLHSFGQNTSGFEISGRIYNAEGKKIYVAPTAQAVAIDSAVIHNGTFMLKGKLKEPDHFALVVEGEPAYTWFILSNAKLTFTGNVDSMRQANITGSKEIKDAKKLRAIIKPYFASQSASFDSTFEAYNRGDSVKGRKFEDMNVSITKTINDSIAAFIKRHPASYISLAQLNELRKSFGAERVKKLFLSLSPSLQNHSVGRQLKYEIFEAEQLTALNKRAITFEQKDTANKLVRLTDYKGKYVLIDFWASWCLPCRAENPTLKKAHRKYSTKGFEIIGVSLDNNKAAWLNAIRKDELPWQNVSDLNGFKNLVAQKYAVTELPTNYLLDPQGKIIAKNLKGDSLMEKLQTLFGE
jgi:thiol-disulfide isomerase/thioredoxin